MKHVARLMLLTAIAFQADVRAQESPAMPDAPTAPDITHPVRHADGRVFIDGLQGTNWGGSFMNREDSQVGCLVAALRCAGQNVSYADVMGLSGCAFKITITPNVDIHPMHSEFGLDWPEIMARVFGMKYTSLALDLNAKKTPPEKALEMVKASTDSGLPVFFMDSEWWPVVGYRDDGKALLCVPYAGLPTGEGYRECPVVGGAWFAANIRKEGKAQERKTSVRESLRTAVRLANTAAIDKDLLCGFAAYKGWQKALLENNKISRHGNAFSYSQLLTSRKAAAEYLDGVSALFDGEPAEQIKLAADNYHAIVDRLYDAAHTVAIPWEQSFTPQNRATEAKTLGECMELEREAISHIKAALD